MDDSELFETPDNFRNIYGNVQHCWEVFKTLWLPIETIGLFL